MGFATYIPVKKRKPPSEKQLALLARNRIKIKERAQRGEIKLGRNVSLKTLQRLADKDAREKFLAFASTNVLPVGDALIKKAKEGDIAAIKEFFDRTWGKAQQTVDVDIKHHFVLRATNQTSDALAAPAALGRIIEHGATHALDDEESTDK